ncbi:GSCOCT00014105001.2-RA-CDS [Cotesia congregata]|uniref:Gustatory receptor 44 n=1 Tax=Cotesia congregata TaxID=51543 RepID=A0A8J2HBC9_COTCN|nr:GSCOCT00014105001.2-RA-CDS [Cotesia congregata]CAG5092849.1 gustatory receptor 44 [Cotesia congregata]
MLIDIGLHCMSTITVILFYVKRKILVSIINKIIYVHNELKENRIYNSQWRDNTYEVLIVVMQIIIIFVVNMRAFETKQQLSSFYNIAAGCILEGVVIQYALCVNFLRKLIHSLNESLLSFANKVDESSNEFLHFNNNLHSDIIKKFIFIRKMQRCIYYEITQELSNFYSYFDCPRIKSEMERFSMELLHGEYCFTASHFFSIDSTLMISIVSTTITIYDHSTKFFSYRIAIY